MNYQCYHLIHSLLNILPCLGYHKILSFALLGVMGFLVAWCESYLAWKNRVKKLFTIWIASIIIIIFNTCYIVDITRIISEMSSRRVLEGEVSHRKLSPHPSQPNYQQDICKDLARNKERSFSSLMQLGIIGHINFFGVISWEQFFMKPIGTKSRSWSKKDFPILNTLWSLHIVSELKQICSWRLGVAP